MSSPGVETRDPPNTISSTSNPNSRYPTATSNTHPGASDQVSPVDGNNVLVDDQPGSSGEAAGEEPVAGPGSSHSQQRGHSPEVIEGVDLSEGPDRTEESQSKPARGVSASTIHADDFAVSLDQVEQQNRPRSVQDPNQRKEVRFADEGEEDVLRRSYSAMPRLNGENNTEEDGKDKEKDKEHVNGSCKDEADQPRQERDDDEDEDHGGGGGGGNRRVGSGRTGSGGHRMGSGQGARTSSREGSAGGRGQRKGSGKQHSYSMTTSSLTNGFEDPGDMNEKKKPHFRRPKTQLGTWEDVMKPDHNTSGLTVEGVRQSWHERDASDDDSGIGGMSMATVTFNIGQPRPKSAKFRNRPDRPQSARHYTTVNHNEYILMAQARMDAREVEETKPRPRSARPASARRVVSAGTNRRKPVSTVAIRPSSATKRVRSAGTTRKQTAKSSRKCAYCKKASSSTINYNQGVYFSVCEDCSKQSNVQNQTQQCNTGSYDLLIQEDCSEPNADNQLVLASNEIVDLETLDRDSSTSGKDSVSIEGGQLLANLDNLEQSLSDVQAEIRECIEQASRSTVDESELLIDLSEPASSVGSQQDSGRPSTSPLYC